MSVIDKSGTVKNASEIDFTGDYFERTAVTHPGFYIMHGMMWKGPFADKQSAKEAYREWAWEAKHS